MQRVQELEDANKTSSLLSKGGHVAAKKLRNGRGLPLKYQKPWRVTHAANKETMRLFGASFPILILDETQEVNNHKAELHSAAMTLPYDAFLGITGTFVPSKWMDIYGLIKILPGNPFDSFEDFMKCFAQSPDLTDLSKDDALVLYLDSHQG
ncbi:uncharacterized protein GLRG_11070 [Colletotrichum graminicola M1.001]|uniref:SNF2 N-terminal domain-containing protein n=1 Tax=Colletotrichum graminicola (strain M1.001 / M2 / FGSC 10212) TaxID=645133 RepID=E3QYE1_COLGM|nr:uncharacterized protein GLRG_11070 [Colletotrichum graminicola M1.001]EFQ35879.1 hypothetical protein GLRG_11070 [Colletotrichum graminicola M1.001]